MSVKTEGSSLDRVLREVTAQSRVRVILDESRQEKISVEFHSVPLDEALVRLIGENFFLVYSSNGNVEEVVVLRNSAPLPTTTGRPDMNQLNSGRVGSVRPSPTAARQGLLRSTAFGENVPFDSLIAEVEGGDVEKRWRAVLALGESKDERAVEAVIGALEDEDSDVRQGAIWALEDLGGQRAIAALEEAAVGDSDESVRQRAVAALAEIGGHEAVGSLSRVLTEDPHPFVRYEALVNLAEIAGDNIIDPLIQALNDPEELIWAKAEEILDM